MSIFPHKSGEERLGQERLAEFQRARSNYLRAEDVRLHADRIALEAKGEYEAAKKGLRRVVES